MNIAKIDSLQGDRLSDRDDMNVNVGDVEDSDEVNTVELNLLEKILDHRLDIVRTKGQSRSRILKTLPPYDYTEQMKMVEKGTVGIDDLVKRNAKIRKQILMGATDLSGGDNNQIECMDEYGDLNIFRDFFIEGRLPESCPLSRSEFYRLYCNYVIESVDNMDLSRRCFYKCLQEVSGAEEALCRKLDLVDVENQDIKKATINLKMAVRNYINYKQECYQEFKNECLITGGEMVGGFKMLINDVLNDETGFGKQTINSVNQLIDSISGEDCLVFDGDCVVVQQSLDSLYKRIVHVYRGDFFNAGQSWSLRKIVTEKYHDYVKVYESLCKKTSPKESDLVEGQEVTI